MWQEVVLNHYFQPWHSNPLDKQFNIIHAMRSLIRETTIQWQSKHLKVYQDEEAILMLDKVQWNSTVDKVAKEHWQQLQITPNQQIIRFQSKPWWLWLNCHYFPAVFWQKLLFGGSILVWHIITHHASTKLLCIFWFMAAVEMLLWLIQVLL